MPTQQIHGTPVPAIPDALTGSASDAPTDSAPDAPTGSAADGHAPRSASRRTDDAIALLSEDHARVAQLFKRFDTLQSDGPQKASLVERICDELECAWNGGMAEPEQ